MLTAWSPPSTSGRAPRSRILRTASSGVAVAGGGVGVDDVGVADVDDAHLVHRQVDRIVLVVVGAAVAEREQRRGLADRARAEARARRGTGCPCRRARPAPRRRHRARPSRGRAAACRTCSARRRADRDGRARRRAWEAPKAAVSLAPIGAARKGEVERHYEPRDADARIDPAESLARRDQPTIHRFKDFWARKISKPGGTQARPRLRRSRSKPATLR